MAPEDATANFPWAVLMGGGSMPNLIGLDPTLIASNPTMQPIDLPHAPAGQYVLGRPGGDYLIYCSSAESGHVELPLDDNKYTLHWIDPRSGKMTDSTEIVSASAPLELKSPGNEPFVCWLKHN